MSFTLCGPSLCLFLFSHNGYFKSLVINLHTEPELLVKLVVMAAYGDNAWLGYDKAYHSIIDTKYVHFQGKWHRVLVVLVHAKGLQGRGTHVLLVQVDRGAKPFVLKDTYHNVDWATDGDIYRLLQDQGQGSVAEDSLGAGGENGLLVFIGEEVAPLVPLEEWARKLCPSSQYKQAKRHLRITFQTLTVGITWFSCAREFLDTFIDAVEGKLLLLYDPSRRTDITLKHMNMHAMTGKNSTATSVIPTSGCRWNCGVTGEESPPEGPQASVKALAEAAVPSKPEDSKEEWYPWQQGMLEDWGFAQDQKSEPSQKVRYLTVR